MNTLLKSLVELGITPDVPSYTRRGIRLVNTLSILTGASAFILAPLLTAITHQPIMWPGFLETAAFMFSLYLNYRKQYFLSALIMLLTQNLAAVYFGILLGQGISIKMLFISLAITAVFIFRDLHVRGIGLMVAFISMTLLNLNDHFHIITPWMFTSSQHELIKWLADGIIFIITCIAVLFFVQQNQRASENKTSFLRETNHEINKSLEAMMSTVNKYLHQSEEHESVTINTKDLQVIGLAARTMSDIVKAGLNLSMIEAGKYDNHEKGLIETRTLLQEIVSAYAALSLKKGITIRMSIDEDVPAVIESDRNKLITILSNIFLNAIKFSHDNSSIEIELGVLESSLLFHITDFGKGINHKRLANFFEEGLYVSERNELIQGYGVGMALTKRYVDFLDGKISVESQLGKGTTFTVEIPVRFHDGHMLDLGRTMSAGVHSSLLSGKCILLVDDDRMTLEYACQCFHILGCKDVSVAHNADEGMGKARLLMPDLILIDVQLPDRNGLEVVRELRNYKPLQDIPIIAASSENSDILREEAAEAGASLFLQKPYTLHDLRNNMAKVFTIGV
jgi:signal transduction histidine kinase/CheY-like chemotaxis protein